MWSFDGSALLSVGDGLAAGRALAWAAPSWAWPGAGVVDVDDGGNAVVSAAGVAVAADGLAAGPAAAGDASGWAAEVVVAGCAGVVLAESGPAAVPASEVRGGGAVAVIALARNGFHAHSPAWISLHCPQTGRLSVMGGASTTVVSELVAMRGMSWRGFLVVRLRALGFW